MQMSHKLSQSRAICSYVTNALAQFVEVHVTLLQLLQWGNARRTPKRYCHVFDCKTNSILRWPPSSGLLRFGKQKLNSFITKLWCLGEKLCGKGKLAERYCYLVSDTASHCGIKNRGADPKLHYIILPLGIYGHHLLPLWYTTDFAFDWLALS